MKKMFLGACALALLASVSAVKPAEAGRLDRYDVLVINSAASTITTIYAYSVEAGENYGDILPGTIEPGQSKLVTFSDGAGGCRWKVKAVLANNSKTDWVEHNICSLNSWTINKGY